MSRADWEELDELLSKMPPEDRRKLAETYVAWIKRSSRFSRWISWAGAILVGGPMIWLVTLSEWGKGVSPKDYITAAVCIAAGIILIPAGERIEGRWREKNPFPPDTNP